MLIYLMLKLVIVLGQMTNFPVYGWFWMRCRVHMAYFLVHSLAHSLYLCGSVLYSLAISGTRGSSGFGSQSSEQMDRSTWGGRVRGGDQGVRADLPLIL